MKAAVEHRVCCYEEYCLFGEAAAVDVDAHWPNKAQLKVLRDCGDEEREVPLECSYLLCLGPYARVEDSGFP